MPKQIALTIVAAIAISAALPTGGYAATYNLDIASNGTLLSSPVGTVDITSTGTTLTYEFNLSSGTLSTVYLDVSGNVSGLSTNGTWSGDQGATTNVLGTFTDSLSCLHVGRGCGSELTVTFTGTDLVANDTLFDGDLEMFSAANTSTGLFGDTPVPTAPLPAAFPLFAGGLGALGLVSLRRKRKSVSSRSDS